MNEEQPQPAERLDIALERIAAEKVARTGRLDLRNLGLRRLPEELYELEWLYDLELGGVFILDWVGKNLCVLRRRPDLEERPTDEAGNANHLDELGLSLARLSRLRVLDCFATHLADLAPLAGLDELQVFNCAQTQVADIAPLAGLRALLLLDCHDTQITDLAPLAGLTALRSLDCHNTRIANLSPLVGLTALQSLDCKDTQVADLGPLAGLTSLQSLDCKNTQVADLGPLARLTALQSLHCRNTKVADLTPLAGLAMLQFLDCWNIPVTDLAPLAGLTALQLLSCAFTRVADLSPLAALTSLQSLDCWGTQVADLAPLAGLTALQSLRCVETRVADLAPLAQLRMLQSLDCRSTLVVDLAPLAGLDALREVDCFNAPIAKIPEALIGSTVLERLIVSPGPGLAAIPAEVLSQKDGDNCLPRLRAHLADLRSGAEPLRDLKVIVLGNGRIGKTQICRRLRGEPFEPDADSTHGISVASVELAMQNGEDAAILNLWDFGGQDIYHGTHALFMRTRAVFLLVWTPGSEDGEHEHGGMVFRNRPLPYWLEYIRHLGGESSPVILVQNQCDGGRGERANLPVDAEQLRPFEEDGRLFTRLAYSAKDDTGRARLMEALQLAVTGLREVQGRPLIGRNRLAVWEQLRAWRDADAGLGEESGRLHRLLPYRDFEALCRAHAVHGPETFAEVLHHAGMVFYRPGLFGDQLVLDQSWALNAVYALFTREGGVYATLRRLGGRFTRADLDALLWRGRGLSAQDQESLLDMMQTSGVCFVHREESEGRETEYVAPELLPEGRAALAEELAARWDPLPGEPLEAAFVYPFLSPSIARAVLSELGTLAGDTALYWRFGICLYDSASRASAICEEVPDGQGYGGRVLIQTKGAGAQTLLRGLVERIGRLNERSGWTNRLLESDLPRSGAAPSPTIAPTTPPAVPPAEPEVYVSYAWARERQDPLVDELCAALGAEGLHVRRDSTELQPGDRISRYMERLSAGRCIVLVLSGAYLRSLNCMTELHRIYANTGGREHDFVRHIVPLVQEDARIGTASQRNEHAAYWEAQYEELDALIKGKPGLIGVETFRRFKIIGDFYRHVDDILTYANDVLVPRERAALTHDGFALVRGLIERALD